MTTIEIGVDEKHRKLVAGELSKLLADTYTLYLKTQNYHWNVVGPMFSTLHQMFELQYNELALAVDLIAERIRSLGELAPATYRQFSELTALEEDRDVPDAAEMIRRLVVANEAVVRTAHSAFSAAQEADDQPTVDLLSDRMRAHEKAAWMLRSMIQ